MLTENLAVSISRDDKRLRAVELTEAEFVGNLDIHEHNGIDFLDAYLDACQWAELPQHALIQPRNGYIMHFDPHPRSAPLVFLAVGGELVGVFKSDNLTIGSSHQGKHLSRELILAGFAQAPWKNLQNRKVTKAGAAALRSAYRFAKDIARQLEVPQSHSTKPSRTA